MQSPESIGGSFWTGSDVSLGRMPMMPGDGSTDGGFSGLQLPLAHILGRDLESGGW